MPAPTIERLERPRLRRVAWRLFSLLVALGPAAFVHAPLLFGEGPLFRDVRHFYQPTERRQQRSWSEGRIPLWNDSEGIGFPEFAEPTAAVFYPGKLVFALPLPWGARWWLYFVAHAGVACFGASRFGRSCGLSPLAALLGGAAYAASGELLFQSCNPVYLVGAAWLPWALAATTDLRRTLKLKHAAHLALFSSLALLGGDPQTVYHVGLLILLAFVAEVAIAGMRVLVRRLRRTEPAVGAPAVAASSLREWNSRGRFAALVLLAGAIATGLSAVQILPAAAWLRESDRIASTESDATAGVAAERYDFSVGPWRWGDFVVPEWLGSPFPVHRRWSYALFPEGRIWTPSYYLGLVPVLLLPAALIVSRTRRRLLLPLGLAILALAFATGEYGAAFFAEQIARYRGARLDLDDPVGGPYWLLVQAAPLYDLFRYPAKWMPAATLGIAVAGAAGLDALRYRVGRRATAISAGALATALLGGWSLLWLPNFREAWFAMGIGPEPTFGPWDAPGALSDLALSLLYAIAVAVTVFVIVALAGLNRRSLTRAAAALVLLAAIDPAVANRDLVPTGRYSVEPATTIDWASLGVETEGPLAMRFLRGNVDSLTAAEWKDSSSPDRLSELAEWERASYRPRLGPDEGPPAFRSHGSLEPADLSPLLSEWGDWHLTSRAADAEATIERLEDLSVGILILPPGVRPVRGEFVREIVVPPTQTKLAVWRLPDARPRWSWSDDPALVARAAEALRTREELALSREESENLHPVERLVDDERPNVAEGVGLEFAESDAQSVEVRYEAPEPAVLLWNDRYDPGWDGNEMHSAKSGVVIDDRPIGRATPGVRFVVVHGSGTIRFVYRPASFGYGAAISFATLVLLIVGTIVRRGFRRRLSSAPAQAVPEKTALESDAAASL